MRRQAFLEGASALETSQRALLAERILRPNRATAFGNSFDFERIDSAEAYRDRVPLVDHEAHRVWLDRVVAGETAVLTAEAALAFFRTSGSQASPKLIPVTTELMRQKVAAFTVFWESVYARWPTVRDGAIVSNFSDASEPESLLSGVQIHSESGFWARRGRVLQSDRRWPLPAAMRTLSDPAARAYATARLLLQAPLVCIMCLNPSTLLQFCRTVRLHAPALAEGLASGGWGRPNTAISDALDAFEPGSGAARLRSALRADEEAAARLSRATRSDREPPLCELWPDLKLVICWCSRIVQPYHTLLRPYLAGVALRDYITQSSECMMAIPLEDGGSGGALAYAMHFFEFIPENDAEADSPRTLFAWEVMEGERYEVVVSTGGGLYRYRMGDCVRVTGFVEQVPLIEFLYRIGRTSSMTGEKLTEYQVVRAGRGASAEIGFEPQEFVCYPSTGEHPHYGLLVDVGESSVDDDTILRWAGAFDRHLGEVNGEYADKCASERLGRVRAWRVAPGSLREARHARKADGVSDEQVKAEVLTSRPDLHRDADAIALGAAGAPS